VPEVEETVKWNMPFFIKDGIFLANMAAFKSHCSFGIWGAEVKAKLKAQGLYSKDAMGTLGRITSPTDLPGDKDLIAYLRAGAAVIADGTRTKSYTRPKAAAKPESSLPADFAAALKKNKQAKMNFDAFAPGHRREYIDWITEAKREATRTARLAQAIAWLTEGKHRNWKYE
jgi:uncharacterized protein YdeI (YjbR/CyaY-like superfamily)